MAEKARRVAGEGGQLPWRMGRSGVACFALSRRPLSLPRLPGWDRSQGRAGKAGGGKPPGLTGHSPAPSVTPTESEADTTDLDEDEALGEEQQEQVELEEEELEQEEVIQAARAVSQDGRTPLSLPRRKHHER